MSEQATIPGAAEWLEACEHDADTLTGEQLTAAFAAPSKRKFDRGRKPIEDSPLFGGDRQEEMF